MNCLKCNSVKTRLLGSIYWPTPGPMDYHCEACGTVSRFGDEVEPAQPPTAEQSLEEIAKTLREIRDQGPLKTVVVHRIQGINPGVPYGQW